MTEDIIILQCNSAASARVLLAITVLPPLFPDDSKSVTMIRNAMDVIHQAIQQLNPGQVPVVTADQPLFAIAKHIQQFMAKITWSSSWEDCTSSWLEDIGWLSMPRWHLKARHIPF